MTKTMNKKLKPNGECKTFGDVKAIFKDALDEHEDSENIRIDKLMVATLEECQVLHNKLREEFLGESKKHGDIIKAHGKELAELRRHVMDTFNSMHRIEEKFDSRAQQMQSILDWISVIQTSGKLVQQ